MATPQVTIAADSAVWLEGDGGTQTATFTVTRSGDLSALSRVSYSVDVSRRGAVVETDPDIAEPAGQVDFAPGQTAATITVSWTADELREGGLERVMVSLGLPENAQIVQGNAWTRVVDDDEGSFVVPFLARTNLQDGSPAADQALRGNAQPTTFFFDNLRNPSGEDTIQGFGTNDVLVLTTQLPDADGDRVIPLGDDKSLEFTNGSRIEFQGDGLDEGLRYIGRTDDGQFLYADASVRLPGAREELIVGPNADLVGAPGAAEIFFIDAGLDLQLSPDSGIIPDITVADHISEFGMEDILVTTKQISTQASNDEFNVPGLTGLAGRLYIQPWSEDEEPLDPIQNLQYFGSTTHAGVEYYVYGLPGSSHSPDELLFVPPLAPDDSLSIRGFDPTEDVLTVPTEAGAFSLSGYSGERYLTMVDVSGGSSSIAGAQVVRWTRASTAADTLAEVDALLQTMPGGSGGLLFIGYSADDHVAVYYDRNPGEAGGLTLAATLEGLTDATDLAASNFRPTGATLPVLDVGPANITLTEGDTTSTAFEFTVTRSGDLSEASTVQWKVLGSAHNQFAGSLVPSGSLSFDPGQSTATFVVNAAGDKAVEPEYTFTVELNGPSGAAIGTATATGTIVDNDVSTQPPVAYPAFASGTEDDEVITGSVTATDVDGNPISYFSVNDPTGANLIFDGSFTVRPLPSDQKLREGESRVVVIEYRAHDGVASSNTATVTVTINGVNDDPTAKADTASVANGQSVTIDVLANDTDVDAGDTRTITQISPTTLGGEVGIVDGKIVYTADAFDQLGPGQSLTDTFTYTIADVAGATSSATVSVVVSGPSQGFTGTNGSEALTGTAAADLIRAYNGSDTLNGAGGDDTLLGGNGADSLNGGTGADKLDGGDNADTLIGGAGDDLLRGAGGADWFVFGPGFGHDEISDFRSDDFIQVSTSMFADFAALKSDARQVGNDVVITHDGANGLTLAGVQLSSLRSSEVVFATAGTNSANTLSGTAGADLINGYNGDDLLEGGQGADTLAGGNGADSISGGAGKDHLDGGDDADTLNGGTGDDLLRGAGGGDRFVFEAGFAHDEISEFGSDDVVEFNASLFADFAAMRSNADQDGADVVITYDAANTVTLAGVQLSSLHASDFLFA